jgi:hypothetical protein
LSKSKSKVTTGLAFIKTTGEPVYVRDFDSRTDLFGQVIPEAVVVRGVVTQNGIVHQTERFDVEQLETSYDQTRRNAQRTVEFEETLQALREKAETKRYALPTDVRNALIRHQAQNPSSHN